LFLSAEIFPKKSILNRFIPETKIPSRSYSQHDILERDRQNHDEIDQISLIVPEKDDLNQLIDYNDDVMMTCDDEVRMTMAFDCMDLLPDSNNRDHDDSGIKPIKYFIIFAIIIFSLLKFLLVVAAAADSDVSMDDEKEVESRAVESQRVDACRDHADLLTGHLIGLFHQLCVLNMLDFRYLIQFRLRDSLNVPLEEKTFLKIRVNFWGIF